MFDKFVFHHAQSGKKIRIPLSPVIPPKVLWCDLVFLKNVFVLRATPPTRLQVFEAESAVVPSGWEFEKTNDFVFPSSTYL